MMIPLHARSSTSTMNVAGWERGMSNHSSGNNDAHDEDDGAGHQNLPWLGVPALDDPNHHPHHRHFHSNHPPALVDRYPTPQRVAPVRTPPTAASTASHGDSGGFSMLGSARLKRDDSEGDAGDERKPAAREPAGEEAKAPPPRHERQYSYGNDPYPLPPAQDEMSLGSFDGDTQDNYGVAGYNSAFNDADDLALQHSAGMAYAHPPHAYAPPPHARHSQQEPPLNFVLGGQQQYYQHQQQQQHQYHHQQQQQHQRLMQAHGPSVARPPRALEAAARPPAPPESACRRIPRASGDGVQRRGPSDVELAEAPTPRARRAVETWYQRFNELIEYREKYGNCNVPQKYEPNAQLGIWVNKQRMEKKFLDEGTQKTSMTIKRVKLLESIGFAWAKRKGEHSWNQKYNELRAYKKKKGDCNVATKFPDNPALGRWVSTQRSEYKKFQQGNAKHMTQEKIDKLNRIGFRWEMIPSRGSSDED